MFKICVGLSVSFLTQTSVLIEDNTLNFHLALLYILIFSSSVESVLDPCSILDIVRIVSVWYHRSINCHQFEQEVSGVSVMNLINHSLHLEVDSSLSAPPPRPVSSPLCLSTWLIHPSICGHAPIPTDDIPLTFYADIFRLLFCRSGWHRWASVSPTWPSYKAALPAKSGPAHPGTGDLEWVWPYCAAPASPSHHIPPLRLPFCRHISHFLPHRAPALQNPWNPLNLAALMAVAKTASDVPYLLTVWD